MTDFLAPGNEPELWLLLTCALLALVWAASALSGWYVARRRRQMRDFVRGWDSRQDFAHRVAERGRNEKAGLR